MLRDDVRVVGLVLLVYAAVAWVRHRVAQAEMRTAEKLLEIELRLAEIGEACAAQPRPAGPPSASRPPPTDPRLRVGYPHLLHPLPFPPPATLPSCNLPFTYLKR